MRPLMSSLALVAGLLLAQQASAQSVEAVPTNWRIQDYLNGSTEVYFTGSSCPAGALTLPASTPEASKDRFWSVVMTGKAAKLPVGVYYQVSNGQCVVINFYLREQ